MKRISGAEPLLAGKKAVIEASRRELAVFLADLSQFPQDTEVKSALLALIRHYPKSRVRVLYNDLGNALEDGHLLIGLRRRLPTHVALRQCDDRDAADHALKQWWLGDRFHLFHQPDIRRPTAMLDHFAKSAGPQFLTLFDAIWLRASEDSCVREVFL